MTQRSQNINLSKHFSKFIESELKSGRYSSVDEVIAESLELLENKKANQEKLLTLRQALEEGEKSQDLGEFDPKAIFLESKKDLGIISK